MILIFATYNIFDYLILQSDIFNVKTILIVDWKGKNIFPNRWYWYLQLIIFLTMPCGDSAYQISSNESFCHTVIIPISKIHFHMCLSIRIIS